LRNQRNGWIPAVGTFAYLSAGSITVPSGAQAIYQKGDKICITQTTKKYFYIIGVSDTVLTILVNADYALANATITSPLYSKIENPLGFPAGFNISDRQHITISTGGKVMIDGWAETSTTGSSPYTNEWSIGFGLTFAQVPILLVTPIRREFNASYSGADYTSGTFTNVDQPIGAPLTNVTTVGNNDRIFRASGTWTNGKYVRLTWIAIGRI
jgi:hypothetical protein